MGLDDRDYMTERALHRQRTGYSSPPGHRYSYNEGPPDVSGLGYPIACFLLVLALASSLWVNYKDRQRLAQLAAIECPHAPVFDEPARRF